MRVSQVLIPALLVAGVVVFVPSSPAARAADQALISTWRTADVTADGLAGDWTKLERVEHGPGMGIQNDTEFLYLALATSDPELRPALASGVVIWFDPLSKKLQNAGVRLSGVERRPLPGAEPEPPMPGSSGARATNRALATFDWLGPGKNERRLVDVEPRLGVEAASGVDEGVLVYELRIPLARTADRPFAVSAAPGGTLSIGLESPSDPPQRGNGPGAGRGGRSGGGSGPMPGGGIPGGGMRGGGMPGGGGPIGGDFGRGFQPPKPMKLVWVNVTLAQHP